MRVESLLKGVWIFSLYSFVSLSCSNKHHAGLKYKKNDPPEPNIPVGLDHSARAAFVEQYEQGYRLYAFHCARCHGPNSNHPAADSFTDAQLANYTLRGSGEHMPVFRNSAITEGELSLIVTFLQYRRSE
jgi:cytochrome c553